MLEDTLIKQFFWQVTLLIYSANNGYCKFLQGASKSQAESQSSTAIYFDITGVPKLSNGSQHEFVPTHLWR